MKRYNMLQGPNGPMLAEHYEGELVRFVDASQTA